MSRQHPGNSNMLQEALCFCATPQDSNWASKGAIQPSLPQVCLPASWNREMTRGCLFVCWLVGWLNDAMKTIFVFLLVLSLYSLYSVYLVLSLCVFKDGNSPKSWYLFCAISGLHEFLNEPPASAPTRRGGISTRIEPGHFLLFSPGKNYPCLR